MPDVEPSMREKRSDDARPTASAASRPSMWDDPLVRAMAFAAVALVILSLVTVISVLLTGVLSPSGPRTVIEKQLLVSGQAVRDGSVDAAVWGEYIAALVKDQQYRRAAGMIEQGRESVDDSATAEFALAETRLLTAQREYERVIEVAQSGQEQIQTAHEEALASGGATARTAEADGVHPNFFLLALQKAYAHREMGRWTEAIAQFDIYIGRHRGAADILVDRAKVKLEAGDTAGAEADFRTALEFIPDSAEALNGLEKMGVAP